jgi:hypothetical protein
VNHDIHATKRKCQAVQIPYITQVETQPRIVKARPHRLLFFFVSGDYFDSIDVSVVQQALCECAAKRPGPARYQKIRHQAYAPSDCRFY